MPFTQTLPATRPVARRSFANKLILVGMLAFLGDIATSSGQTLSKTGSVAGLLALAWLAAVLVCDPRIARNKGGWPALLGAVVSALALLIEPGIIAVCLFPIYLGLAVMLPRYGAFDNALSWLGRLSIHAIVNPLGVILDMGRLGRVNWRNRNSGEYLGTISRTLSGWISIIISLMLPLAGTVVFVLLFAVANPFIARWLDMLLHAFVGTDLMRLAFGHLIFIVFTAIVLWGSVRPLKIRFRPRTIAGPARKPGRSMLFGVGSIVISLFAFNAIFAVQNLSDMLFLWSGARLPEGVDLAEYAHGSAEPLIVTALLAAAFVLVFLRPGSVASQNSTVRLLVYVWIVQNIFLVGSSMLRTANYIEAYSLTGMRVAALIWMMLVAIGLMLIVWRIAMHRSGSWLINANALCLAIVLAICSFTSFDAIIARWNIAHSFQARSDISRIDLDYLRSLGSGALVPMAEVTVNGGAGATGQTLVSGEALAMIRARLQERVEKSQADWRHWTVSDALRLRAATALPAAIPTHSSDPL